MMILNGIVGSAITITIGQVQFYFSNADDAGHILTPPLFFNDSGPNSLESKALTLKTRRILSLGTFSNISPALNSTWPLD